VYGPDDLAGASLDDIGLPGQYPYTRGPYPTMYRGRNWTMRQIAGFGTGEDTNGRFRYLIAQGQTGLSGDDAQSLHTNGLDEAYAIPSELTMKIALRTQQIIADETHVTDVVDPLGGSYYLESLTNRIEAEVFAILKKVDEMGDTIKAVEEGWFQREIADSAYETARRRAVAGRDPQGGPGGGAAPGHADEIGARARRRTRPSISCRPRSSW
jgi:methylmalonyl-CoA mutase N-terminal domain/subunit